jgi:hypothetical protein
MKILNAMPKIRVSHNLFLQTQTNNIQNGMIFDVLYIQKSTKHKINKVEKAKEKITKWPSIP